MDKDKTVEEALANLKDLPSAFLALAFACAWGEIVATGVKRGHDLMFALLYEQLQPILLAHHQKDGVQLMGFEPAAFLLFDAYVGMHGDLDAVRQGFESLIAHQAPPATVEKAISQARELAADIARHLLSRLKEKEL